MQISEVCGQAPGHERELDLQREAEKLAELTPLVALKVCCPVYTSEGERVQEVNTDSQSLLFQKGGLVNAIPYTHF